MKIPIGNVLQVFYQSETAVERNSDGEYILKIDSNI